MENSILRRWTLITAMGVLGALRCLAAAEAAIQLFPYDTVWSYSTYQDNFGAAWKEVDYDDSAWASGPGVLGFPLEEPLPAEAFLAGASVRTVLPEDPEIITYCFRTHFQLDDPTPPILMTASNLVDDGAVFYLNGVPVGRIAMPAGYFDSMTYADRASEVSSDGVEVLTWVPTNLVAGDNVIAVEVHQGTYHSSDLILGMELSYQFIAGPVIVSQPVDATTEVGKAFKLAAQITGFQPSFQWQKSNGQGAFTNLAGATGSAYGVAQSSVSHTGDYRLIVSNLGGSVTSRVAQVEILPDGTGPSIVAAIALGPPPYSQCLVRFSERVSVSSALRASNYSLQEVGGTNLSLSPSGFPVGELMRLRTDTLVPENDYVLTVSNIQDQQGNVIAPGSQVPVLFETNVVLVPMDQWWRWTEDPVPLPSEWRTNHLDPYLYGERPGVFYNTTHAFDLCRGTRNTFISLGGAQTYYFSTTFVLPEWYSEDKIQLTHLVGDGAVFYLNGQEIFRYNMPTGDVSYDTPPKSGITEVVCITNSFTVTNLLVGTNLLAAEVHPYFTDRNVVFGLELQAPMAPRRSLPSTPVPTLDLQRQDQSAVLSWTGGGWALEWAASVAGPWQELQPMTNPCTASLPTSGNRFWRLRQKQY